MVIKDVKNVDEQNTQQENVDDLIDEINIEDLFNKAVKCGCCCSSHGGGKSRYE
jgi:hypothetical protein